MSSIGRGLERALVSALEAVVLARADGHVESFARHILQPAAAAAIKSRPAQRFAVAAAMTHAQPAVLPEFAGRAEPIWSMNVSTEATSTDGPNARHRAQQLDLGK